MSATGQIRHMALFWLKNPGSAEDRAMLAAGLETLRDIEQAIRDTPNLGVNPSNDGSIIRVTMPELTEERRKDYVKLVRGKGEDARVAVRNIRRRAKDDLDALKSEVGDDEVARGEKDLEALTKSHIDLIDDALKRKEAELLEI